MPNKNNTIPNIGASIHIFMNGFSFCTPSKTDFIPFTEGPDSFKTLLQELVAFYPKHTFAATQVVYYSQPSTFVPTPLFDAKLLPSYLRFYGEIEKSHHLDYEELEEQTQIQVYALPTRIDAHLKEIIVPVYTCHYNSILYRNISSFSKELDGGTQLYIHLQSKGLDLYLVEKSTVLFQNHFKIQNEDEFLYYVFFVVEQYKLQAEDFQIYFLGEIPSFKSYYQAIKQYHTPIQFKENALTSAIDIDQHPAPFMAQSSY
jgi:hypothetical protein